MGLYTYGKKLRWTPVTLEGSEELNGSKDPNFGDECVFCSIMVRRPFVEPWPIFQLLNQYIVGRTPWIGDQPLTRPLPTCRTTQTRNKRTQTSMPSVGFEPTISVCDRAKTVHALDRAVTVRR
jgi:hypothetical protein